MFAVARISDKFRADFCELWKLTHSLFSSYNEANVRLTYGKITEKITYIPYRRSYLADNLSLPRALNPD